MKNKKGSMELGINAIVILIIALALLGLAMGFVTNLFKGGEKKLGGLIERTDLPVHADAGNPLVFDSSDITVKSGKNANVVASVYNNNFGDEEVSLAISSCINSDGSEQTEISLNSPVQTIPRGNDGGYMAIIYVGDVSAGTYICTVQAASARGESVVSKQLFVNVIV